MNCPYCDNPVPPNVGECPSCGARVQQPPQYQQPPYPPQYPPPQYQQQQYRQQFAQQQQATPGNSGAANVTMFTALRRFGDFSGRSCRKEFWLWVLFEFIMFLVVPFVNMLLVMDGEPDDGPKLSFVIGLVCLVPNLSVAVRRLHDTGRSGWNLMVGFIPCVGGLILLIFMLLDSTPGTNQYGPNPKGM